MRQSALDIKEQVIKGCIREAIVASAADNFIAAPGRVLAEDFTPAEKERIAAIVRKEIKGQPSEAYLLKIIRNVLTQLFKTLYTRRAFWRDGLNTNAE